MGEAKPELLPCPFCGKTHTLIVGAASEMWDEDQNGPFPHTETYAVFCDASTDGGKGGCGGSGGNFLTKEDAAEAWNRRSGQLVERVKELEGALRGLDDAYCRAGSPLTREERFEDRKRLIAARAALSKARPNTAEGEAAQQAPAAERENLELRRMLCIAHAGAAAYMDDGEAQDNRELPLIDFLRDTPAEIQDKLQRRALKKLAMTTEATPARWPSYEVAVSDPVFQVARSIMGTENMGQDRQLVAAINHVLAAAPAQAAAKEPSP